MRTSMELSDSVLRKAKALARKRNTTLRQIVEEAIRMFVDKDATTSYEMIDCSFGEGGLVDGLDFTDWETIRDRAYGQEVDDSN